MFRHGRWLVLLAGGAWLFGCSLERPAAAPDPSPWRGPALPAASPASASVTPAPWSRKAFTFGPHDQLALYERASQDLLVFPEAGTGLHNASTYGPYQIYFDDGRDILLYDFNRAERVTLVSGDEVGGFAFAPAIDDHDTLYFLFSHRSDLSFGYAYAKYAREEATPSSKPLEAVLGKAFFLSPINAVGARHGGLTSINVHVGGEPVVFTTGDGGLYAYFPTTREVQALLAADLGPMHASDVNIDPVWGRFVAWTDTERESLYVLDRWTGQVDPVPMTRLGFVAASGASFTGKDPYHVLFTATWPDGSTRLMEFGLLTEQIVALSLPNLLP